MGLLALWWNSRQHICITKFAIIGHSYVRHLQQAFPTRLTVDEVDFECSFFGYSGAKFRTLVEMIGLFHN